MILIVTKYTHRIWKELQNTNGCRVGAGVNFPFSVSSFPLDREHVFRSPDSIVFHDSLLPPEKSCTKHTTPGGAKDISSENLPKTLHSWWIFSFLDVKYLLWLEPTSWITAYLQRFSAGWRAWHLTTVQMRKLRPERGSGFRLLVTKLEVKQVNLGCCFHPFLVYAAQTAFPDSGVEGSRSGLMGFPWGRPEGRVVVEVEGSELRWWI